MPRCARCMRRSRIRLRFTSKPPRTATCRSRRMTVPVVEFTVAGKPATHGLGRPYTVVYDGTCKVCTRLAKVLRKWDREEQLEIVPSQAPGVTARFPWIPARAYAEA